jgi:transposase-like protein
LIREYFWLIVTTKEWDMRETSGARKSPGEKIVKDIKRATRKQYSSEEKIRIVLDGLRGEHSIAELCRREGISQGIYNNGPRTLWKLASAGWLAIQCVQPRVTRSKTCAGKHVISRKLWRSKRLSFAFSKKA